ncbi:MAG: phage holin family protein [Lachnospiraceae bacterium]|jgi:toxin secretion/phage lysis holin|nr:phage holin family protein [Lachnospiraceae bacterium]
MREGKGIQATVVLIFTTLTAWLGHLAIPMYVLVACNVVDYLTGLMAAPHRGEHPNSYKGFNGIAKKVCMWILVGVGAMIDILITYAAEQVSPGFMEPFIVAIVVALWLAFNEMISILENIRDIGVVLPPFMLKLITKLKKTTENIVEKEVRDADDENRKSDSGDN